MLKNIFKYSVFILFAHTANAGEIAITFDDAPMHSSAVMSGEERTKRIISTLKKNDVQDALFFVTGKHITDESVARLHQYAEAGYTLGNHSFSHESANKTDADDFLLDAYKAHLIIKKYETHAGFYRFPYLHPGDTEQKRQAILDGLAEMGYRPGYVTVDNFDWYINSLYVKAVESSKKVNMDNLAKLYVDVLWECIQFYDQIAINNMGKSPKHVLLLHENDTAALFLGDLIKKIRSEGWSIITPSAAYNDQSLNKHGDNFDFAKQGRVAAIAHSKGVDTVKLRHPSENTEYLDQLFNKYEVY